MNIFIKTMMGFVLLIGTTLYGSMRAVQQRARALAGAPRSGVTTPASTLTTLAQLSKTARQETVNDQLTPTFLDSFITSRSTKGLVDRENISSLLGYALGKDNQDLAQALRYNNKALKDLKSQDLSVSQDLMRILFCCLETDDIDLFKILYEEFFMSQPENYSSMQSTLSGTGSLAGTGPGRFADALLDSASTTPNMQTSSLRLTLPKGSIPGTQNPQRDRYTFHTFTRIFNAKRIQQFFNNDRIDNRLLIDINKILRELDGIKKNVQTADRTRAIIQTVMAIFEDYKIKCKNQSEMKRFVTSLKNVLREGDDYTPTLSSIVKELEGVIRQKITSGSALVYNQQLLKAFTRVKNIISYIIHMEENRI